MISIDFLKFADSYTYTSLLACVGFSLIIFSGFLLNYFYDKKNMRITTKKITYCAALVSVIVVFNALTIWIGKGFLPQTLEYRLGDIIQLIPGMLFGPFLGVICSFCADFLGVICAGNLGQYHFGFTFEAALTSFIGGIIFLFSNRKNWIFYVIVLYSLNLLIDEFLLTPLWLGSTYHIPNAFKIYEFNNPAGIAAFTSLVISVSIKLPTYLLVFFPVFSLVYNLTNSAFNKNELWINRNGELKFILKKDYFIKLKNHFFSKLPIKNI